MSRLSYKTSGVDIKKGDQLVRDIRRMARSTWRPGVLTEIGGFSGAFLPDLKKYKRPVLVSGTDGVGTKLKVAQLMNRHETVGIDLVAMCVNDLVVTGADPLFFLDYIATGKLNRRVSKAILSGITKGCRLAGCTLLGGETAELPSMFKGGEYDLAGFAVGIVEKNKMIDGKTISKGDVLVGLPSSGIHSNGLSLARNIIFDRLHHKPSSRIPGLKKNIGEELLTPTRIYVETIKKITQWIKIKGIAHITGGGLTLNIPRILPRGLHVSIKRGSWPVPPIFDYLESEGKISKPEMYQVFNMGVGMVLVVSPHVSSRLFNKLARLGEKAFLIGKVVSGNKPRSVVYV